MIKTQKCCYPQAASISAGCLHVKLGQILFVISTNIFSNLSKYIFYLNRYRPHFTFRFSHQLVQNISMQQLTFFGVLLLLLFVFLRIVFFESVIFRPSTFSHLPQKDECRLKTIWKINSSGLTVTLDWSLRLQKDSNTLQLFAEQKRSHFKTLP